ncbi:MAG: hypothetical protein AAFQ94_11925 [Bacteroidota bacterium]
MRKVILLLITIHLTGLAYGQNPKVAVVSKATENSIKLRWAPNTPVLWQLSNQYGYQIWRYTVSFEGKVLSPTPKVVLTKEPIKPIQLSEWETVADSSDYAAVAAQAIYGNSFEVNSNQDNSVMQLINQSKELETRYSFAVYAAEQSVEVARLAGLFYEDKDVRADEQYLYKVFSLAPTAIIEADTGSYYIGLSDLAELPKVNHLSVEFKDQIAVLSWPTKYLANRYSSYFIERSEDGENFKATTEKPVINTFSNENDQKDEFIWIDSLEENSKQYYYRVRGVDAFGDLGTPSKVIGGSGRPDFYFPVNVTDSKTIDNESVSMQWEFDSNATEIAYFLVTRAGSEDGDYQVIAKLDASQRSYVDNSPNISNYYIIEAVDRYGSEVRSLPFFMQLEDLIPPVLPIGLAGKIDTLGRVTLTWTANEESDLLGYRVYRKNFDSDDFMQVTEQLISTNAYTEKIDINNLTKTIYYAVRAIDLRYNDSPFSKTLALKKPDLAPPTAPVISDYQALEEGISLTWINSSSDDVIGHLVYREIKDSDEWILVNSIPITDQVSNYYLDDQLEAGFQYRYTVIAMDESSLESDPAEPVSIKYTPKEKDLIEVTGRVERESGRIVLFWQADPAVASLQLYKATGSEKLSLYKTLEVEKGRFIDEQLILNAEFRYRFRPILLNGIKGKFSKELKLSY